MEGVLLIDKPIGPSSFDVVRKVRACAGIKRVGHAGTLDPLASGLMIILLGRYTKLSGILTANSKVYEATFVMGTSTTTDDNEGEVLEKKTIAHLTKADCISALENFVGKIKQVPPKFSAIKVEGTRSYQLARMGQEVPLAMRDIEVLSAEILYCAFPEIRVRIHCSKGTYIRSLARDMGNYLGVGAHAQKICRVASGNFLLEQALSFNDISKENITTHMLDRTRALAGVEQILITEQERDHLKHGRKISLPINTHCLDAAVAVCGDELIAIINPDAQVEYRMRIF